MNTEQERALKAILRGHNVFLTGLAGTGKSYLIGQIKDVFEQDGKNLAITATTGCAALLLGYKAKTIYSWAGIGLGNNPTETLIRFIRRGGKALHRWLATDVLIIDEISMLPPELFEKLDKIGRALRMNQEKPFGGIQIILVGDFFQLPPVTKSEEETKFIFESPLWEKIIKETIELKQIMRQTDPVFQNILTEVREGRLSEENLAILTQRKGLNWRKEKIRPSFLFSRRMEVEHINSSNLKALKGERRNYMATTEFSAAFVKRFPRITEADEDVQRAVQKLDRDASYQPDLTLAVGAQVMLISNIDVESGLVNGSRGVVTDFGAPPLCAPNVLFKGHTTPLPVTSITWSSEEPEGVMRRQIPLILAWAVTIHKTQGATLDSALIDIGANTFEYGQAYVALSRVKSLDCLYIHDIDVKAIKAHPKVIEFYKALRDTPIREYKEAKAPNTIMSWLKTGAKEPVKIKDPGDLTGVAEDWLDVLEPISETPLWDELTRLVMEARKKGPVYPPHELVFAALRATPLKEVRVVILGQDPYPNPGHGNGLAFSVAENVRPYPPSLRNIFREAQDDLGEEAFPWPQSGDLTPWTKQGVLLINTTLTVDAGLSRSHAKFGWSNLVKMIVGEVSKQCEKVVYVLWGNDAHKFKKYIDTEKHVVLEGVHPSPLSASRGFFESKPFSKVNAAVRGEPIIWSLTK